MSATKIIGWLTFTAGIIIIGSTIYYTYNIFTGATPVPQIFNMDFGNIQEIPEEGTDSGFEDQIRQMLSQQLSNLIPLESLNKFANLITWTGGAWIIITGGSKMSELGIKLIRTPSDKE